MSYSLGGVDRLPNIYRNEYYSVFDPITNLPKDLKDRWQKPGDEADYPRIESAYAGYTGQYDAFTDKDIETVGFVRLKQLTLGYNLNENVSKKFGLSSARIYVTAENLFLLSNYSGLDPEIVSIFDGIDALGSYPLPRKFTIGLSVNF